MNKNVVKLQVGEGGKAALKAFADEIVTAYIGAGITVTVQGVSFKPIKLSSGVPVSASDTVKAKGSETIGKKTYSKGLTIKTQWTDWTLTSGSHF
ncbi:MAG TPA: hypothetical protein VMV72_10285 [Verrucomicrobiae bacterium]|nr:hypothetical protein [Verrucomicrobiae bacterium]